MDGLLVFPPVLMGSYKEGSIVCILFDMRGDIMGGYP